MGSPAYAGQALRGGDGREDLLRLPCLGKRTTGVWAPASAGVTGERVCSGCHSRGDGRPGSVFSQPTPERRDGVCAALPGG